MELLRDYGSLDPIYFNLWKPDGTGLITGVTLDAGDFLVVKDGGTPANVTGTFAEETPGLYSYTPVAADHQCKVAGYTFIDAEAVCLDKGIIVETQNHPLAQHPNGVALAGTAQAGAAGSVTLPASSSSVNDFYNGDVVEIVSGTGAGQSPRTISDYVGSSKVASVEPNWAVTPDGTSVLRVYAVSPAAGVETAVLSALATYTAATAANVSDGIAGVQTKLDDIKAKTDQLAFTSGRLNSNVKAINDVVIEGSGTVGDEWGAP